MFNIYRAKPSMKLKPIYFWKRQTDDFNNHKCIYGDHSIDNIDWFERLLKDIYELLELQKKEEIRKEL